jgi:hypothetical protein
LILYVYGAIRAGLARFDKRGGLVFGRGSAISEMLGEIEPLKLI